MSQRLCLLIDEIIHTEKTFLNTISDAQSTLHLLLNHYKELLDSECEMKLKFMHDQLVVFLNNVNSDLGEFVFNYELSITTIEDYEQKLIEICKLYSTKLVDRQYVYCFIVMIVNYETIVLLCSNLAKNTTNFRKIFKSIPNFDIFKSFPIYFCSRIPRYNLILSELLKEIRFTNLQDQVRNILEIISKLTNLLNRERILFEIAKGLEDYHPFYKLFLGCSVKIIPLIDKTKNNNILKRLFTRDSKKLNIVEYTETFIAMADHLNIFVKSQNKTENVTNFSGIIECIGDETSITHEYNIVKSANVKEFNHFKNEFNWKMSIFNKDENNYLEIRNENEIILINFNTKEEQCIKLWNYLVVERSEKSFICKIPTTLTTQKSLQLSDITIITQI